jgi:hypothetical protein
MAEPSMSELAALIHTLTTKVDGIQAEVASVNTTVAGVQAKVDGLQRGASSSGASGATPGSDEHHSDRPPRFQKMYFPKFDGKSAPLAFINRCESFFHQQRIIDEEQVWMALYNLQDAAQLWYIQVQREEGTSSWRRFIELLNLHFGPILSATWPPTSVPAPSSNTRSALRPVFPAPATSPSARRCSYSRRAFNHP